MKKEQRFNYILGKLDQEKMVEFNPLSIELNISEDTVRRDIEELAKNGLLSKVRGGAIPRSENPLTFKDRIGYLSKDKEVIALKALRLIRNGQTIFLDGGTSVYTLVSLFPADIKLTVITNNVAIIPLLALYNGIKTIVLGGQYMKTTESLYGLEAVRGAEKFRADVFFLAPCSIDEKGVTATYLEEAELKQAMIASSDQVVVLCNFNKLDTKDPYAVCRLEDLSYVITEEDVNCKEFDFYKNAGIVFI
ncbi:DeoR/GlpR transcriptional regulator [Pedobacter sp. PAMC26386]|nr:DeoR/GlpR transcriptional regulator [Pedobacter sp. PAMC26386]